jgi:hypothetical protein
LSFLRLIADAEILLLEEDDLLGRFHDVDLGGPGWSLLRWQEPAFVVPLVNALFLLPIVPDPLDALLRAEGRGRNRVALAPRAGEEELLAPHEPLFLLFDALQLDHRQVLLDRVPLHHLGEPREVVVRQDHFLAALFERGEGLLRVRGLFLDQIINKLHP